MSSLGPCRVHPLTLKAVPGVKVEGRVNFRIERKSSRNEIYGGRRRNGCQRQPGSQAGEGGRGRGARNTKEAATSVSQPAAASPPAKNEENHFGGLRTRAQVWAEK